MIRKFIDKKTSKKMNSMQRRERKKREKLEQQLKEKRDDGRWDNNRFQKETKLWR